MANFRFLQFVVVDSTMKGNYKLLHFTFLEFTESIYDSHYCSLGMSLQHEVSGHTNQCGWLRQSSFVQSWSTGPAVTAVHQGLSKYLTAQDTHISTTSTNHSRTLSSHGNLLSLQPQSTIQKYKTFFVPSIVKTIPKTCYSFELEQLNFQFFIS